MASVADMLKWKCPPIFIMAVLLLRFGTPDSTRPDSLDFVEIFAGQAELSKSLRQVSKLIYFSPKKNINPEIHTFLLQPHAPPCCKAQYNGVSIDFDRDMRTQDLLKPAGFLFLGKLQFFEEGSSGSSLNFAKYIFPGKNENPGKHEIWGFGNILLICHFRVTNQVVHQPSPEMQEGGFGHDCHLLQVFQRYVPCCELSCF